MRVALVVNGQRWEWEEGTYGQRSRGRREHCKGCRGWSATTAEREEKKKKTKREGSQEESSQEGSQEDLRHG